MSNLILPGQASPSTIVTPGGPSRIIAPGSSGLKVADGPRPVPAEFAARLKAFDPTLYVEYNPKRHRWVIEQCVEHLSPTAEHTYICRRIYVWLVQDPEGNYLSLDHADRIFEELARRDTQRAGYEPGPKGLQRFIAEAEYERERDAAKRESEMKEVVVKNRKDQFLTMNRLRLLMDKHGLGGSGLEKK